MLCQSIVALTNEYIQWLKSINYINENTIFFIFEVNLFSTKDLQQNNILMFNRVKMKEEKEHFAKKKSKLKLRNNLNI